MVFVLDNYDSFTYNLVQYLGELGAEIEVRRNDELTPGQVESLHPSHILISPGPCTPQDAASRSTSSATSPPSARQAKSPSRSSASASAIRPSAQPSEAASSAPPSWMHGKTSEVTHDGRTIFTGIPSAMTCTRYHSLIVEEQGLPKELEVSARTPATNQAAGKPATTIMGLRHRTLPIEGVQFHPESVLTKHGRQMIANFLKM